MFFLLQLQIREIIIIPDPKYSILRKYNDILALHIYIFFFFYFFFYVEVGPCFYASV